MHLLSSRESSLRSITALHHARPVLVSMIFDLRSRVPVTLTREKNTATLLARTVQEHYEIVERLRQKDRPGLELIVHQHVLGGLEVV